MVSPFIFVPLADFDLLQRRIAAAYSSSAAVYCSDDTGCYFNAPCSEIWQEEDFSFEVYDQTSSFKISL